MKNKLARLLRRWADKLSPLPIHDVQRTGEYYLPYEQKVLTIQKLRAIERVNNPGDAREMQLAKLQIEAAIREGLKLDVQYDERTQELRSELIYYV